MTLAVVGDSFASLDKRYENLWPKQVAKKLDLELHNLGKCGADTMYIHTQMKYAVEKLNVTHMVVWQTHPDRVLVPRTAGIRSSLSANKVINIPPETDDPLAHAGYEDVYDYGQDYQPLFISDNINTFIERYTSSISKQTANAFKQWTIHLQNNDINNYNKSVYVESMFYYLNERKIKTVIIDIYEDYNFPKSDYVVVLNPSKSDLFIWSSDANYDAEKVPTNHFPIEFQQRVSDYILEYFLEIRNGGVN